MPEEIREVMRFWAKVEAAEAIIKTGKMGQTEAIEAVFNCKRSGRPDSPYASGCACAAFGGIGSRTERWYNHPIVKGTCMEPLIVALNVWETGAPCDDPWMVFFALLLVSLLEARQAAEEQAELRAKQLGE